MGYMCLHNSLLHNRVTQNTSHSFGGEFGLMDALKLHYMSHVRLSSVPSICEERRRERNRGWSQGIRGWGV